MRRATSFLVVSNLLLTGCAAAPLAGARAANPNEAAATAPELAASTLRTPTAMQPTPPPLEDLLRDLPAGAGEAARAFGARLDRFARGCPFTHVESPTPDTVRADFGVVCPTFRGTLEASFLDGGAGSTKVELRFRDYWQRGSDSLSGARKARLASDGDVRFDGPPPWRDVPDPPRARTASRSSARKSSGCGIGKAGKVWPLLPLVGACVLSSLLGARW